MVHSVRLTTGVEDELTMQKVIDLAGVDQSIELIKNNQNQPTPLCKLFILSLMLNLSWGCKGDLEIDCFMSWQRISLLIRQYLTSFFNTNKSAQLNVEQQC